MTIGTNSSGSTRRYRFPIALGIVLFAPALAPELLHAAPGAALSGASAVSAQRALAAIRASLPALVVGNVDLIARNALAKAKMQDITIDVGTITGK